MSEHPIEGLMKTAMESIKEMVDVNTVVGDAVETPDGTVIIPISRVGCGFAAGGSEFNGNGKYNDEKSEESSLPFGGGSGAGMSVQPVGFLVVGNGQVRLMPVNGKNAFLERLVDMAPQVFDNLESLIKKRCHNKSSSIKNTVGAEYVGTIKEEK
ncbi:MAG: GerW family sporulation protein [Clostridia bacterium]|nr:GerW family sporulation protein [Clostridia bacterium]MDD4048866.1 GerW family sporulation protein [Clostridia bacterium]